MPDKPPLTVLLVDDRESNRYAVSRILQKAHFVVREAGTGEDALHLAAQKPDLVILDINLPDLSGYEVCRRINADPATASIPVLHLSATFVGSEDRAEGLEGGADGYLTYPLEPRELVAHVQALLRIRQAEKEARQQRELLRVTLSSIGDGIVATDAEGVITFLNPVAESLIGWTQAEALGKRLKDVFHLLSEEGGRPVENPVDKVIQSGSAAGLPGHSILVSRDGSRRPVDDTAGPIRDEEGRFVGVVLVFRDIGERRRLEREVQRRSEELVDRDRRKDEFLAMLAHELRNPLAPILNSLNVLMHHHTGDPEFQRVGGVMHRQLGNLVRLVDDLMDVSRITRGKVELRKEQLELRTVVARAAESVRPFVEERQHRLEIALPDRPVRLEADPARLEQVLTNLLNNAAKYSPPGGRIRLVGVREGTGAVIRIRDDGIGIRPENLVHIFDPFQQADRVPGRVSEGLGIGLTLVRSLVELHGGKVAVSSAGPGLGSEFTVRLPALPETAADETKPPAEAKVASARPLRVLITDDNVDAAESLAMLLRLVGHEVRTVHDGPAALEAARAFHPQAVFLDLGLPRGMDGFEVARRLRGEPGLEKAVLVAMTGYGQPEDVERARAAGMNAHLTKPADLAAVQQLLAAVPGPALA